MAKLRNIREISKDEVSRISIEEMYSFLFMKADLHLVLDIFPSISASKKLLQSEDEKEASVPDANSGITFQAIDASLRPRINVVRATRSMRTAIPGFVRLKALEIFIHFTYHF